MKHADSLISARWIIPVEPHATVLEEHTVVVVNGTIEAVLPTREALADWQCDHPVELPGHALIPGLVNAHTHAAMSLMRGMADDLPLMTWLNEHIWPAEARWVGEGFVRDGTRLAIAEMVRSGTTCFNDMYFFTDIAARVASDAGMRACIGMIVIDFPTAWAADHDDYLRKGLAVHDHYRHDPLITTAFAPHAPYTVSDLPLQRIATYAEELDVPIHIHVHETAGEVAQALEQSGDRPLARLDRLGLVSRRLMAVHMTALDDDDIARVAAGGASVVHCPQSNLKLASGLCPVQRLLDAGINVALGTDGAASNNDLDLLGEMQSAALIGKITAGNAAAVDAASVLRMATLGGATALGLDDRIGSITPGKAADLTAIDLSALETQPVYHPISQIVYAAGREQVSDVWVAGRRLLKQRRLTTLDEETLLASAAQWRERMAEFD